MYALAHPTNTRSRDGHANNTVSWTGVTRTCSRSIWFNRVILYQVELEVEFTVTHFQWRWPECAFIVSTKRIWYDRGRLILNQWIRWMMNDELNACMDWFSLNHLDDDHFHFPRANRDTVLVLIHKGRAWTWPANRRGWGREDSVTAVMSRVRSRSSSSSKTNLKSSSSSSSSSLSSDSAHAKPYSLVSNTLRRRERDRHAICEIW